MVTSPNSRWPSRSASASLIVELGAILALLMAWQFTAAEFLGGLTVIFVLAALFRL
ncbi:hypothetical protein ACFRCW_28935 [Streptomyces sp. NPDC056653]|uniref:hypothetical protein n=1 Tax=unclassified Streptomyces TaxID=2593676 RepID=UPI0033B2C241